MSREHPKIHAFKEILDSLDSTGGHIFICIVIGTIGVSLGLFVTWFVWPDKELATLFAGITGGMSGFFQIAAYAMQGRGKANGVPHPANPAEPKQLVV